MRIDSGKHSVECVVRRDAMGQIEEGPQPLQLGLSKEFHIREAFTAGKLRTQANDKDIDKLVQAGPFDARVGPVLQPGSVDPAMATYSNTQRIWR